MNRKNIVIISVISFLALFAILFIPIPQEEEEDGTREYISLTYKLVDWNRETEDGELDEVRIYFFHDRYKSLDSLWEEEFELDEDPDDVTKTKIKTFLAEIVEIDRKNATVEPLRSEDEYDSCDTIVFSIKDLDDIDARVGDVVKITYDGEIKESYPAQISPSKWKIHERRIDDVCDDKPVIYLYPQVETDVTVKLDFDGDITCTYPLYQGEWNVTAYPDGHLVDENGMIYNYLYWEGITNAPLDISSGFCIPGSETAAFLEDALAQLGLSRKEANEFIVYWLPQMQNYPYNIISFRNEEYLETAVLDVSPKPDTEIRVFMTWTQSDEYVEIPPQELSAPEREGFVLVEWGGAYLPS